jgi:hypothetical protein
MKMLIGAVLALSLAGAVAHAQGRQTLPAPAQSAASAARESRYQIGLMEGILQRAAEHGAKVTRDRVRVVVPGDMLLSDEVRVRGFSLEGYGVFFDVDMPDLEETLPWIFRTLDQNSLGLDSALRSLRALTEANGNANDRQALQRIEMQLAPSMAGAGPQTVSTLQNAGSATGSASALTSGGRGGGVSSVDPVDAVVSDPQGVYRAEVTEALIEAMLDHSSGLRLAPTDWLVVAARGREGVPRLSPADTESPTIQISVRGEDLNALLARQLSREDARRRVVIKVF